MLNYLIELAGGSDVFAAAQVVSRQAWFCSNAQYWRVLAGLAVFDAVSMTPVDRNWLRKALLRSGDSAEAIQMSRSRPLRMAPVAVLQLVAPDVIGALIDRWGVSEWSPKLSPELGRGIWGRSGG